MEERKQVLVLGDSILKGIQVDPETKKYVTRNEMDVPGLESRFDLQVRNESHFGATVEKGKRLLDRLLKRQPVCDYLVMDFGGNDCDFKWAEIAARPGEEHLPNVPLAEFTERYRELVRVVKAAGIRPILTTLPPLVSQRFFDWWCRGLDQGAVLGWLGDVNNIYAWQENYSRTVERLAEQEQAELVDLRGAFLQHGPLEALMCEDGTHPNSAGQALIGRTFREFAERRRACPQTA